MSGEPIEEQFAEDPQAQTAIKRGYLNVLHAREAIARHAADAATLVPADPSHQSPSSRSA